MSDTERYTSDTDNAWERVKRKHWDREWDLDTMIGDE
jgi:hypothetical protein